MVNFERSFKELKNKTVWIHYAIGTLGISGIFWWLMENNYLTAESPFWHYLIIFYVVYIVVDRASHGILELF